MPARHNRVTRGEDYRRIVRTGNRVGGALCITYAVPRSIGDNPTDTSARFGFIISKAVGNAVTRNLLRRRMKSVTEEFIRDGVSGVDIVFRALPKSASASFDELRHEMRRSVRRIQSE
ncbi:ribonuclease P protein component [Leucobacter aridicollis]|uniref:ribonuclease P protein component n=1 Tax=Leucobacter aridicollis TaxID=283878 RepID=UPI000E65B54C|nr:ribonuclease P protein component [Leucobacter aridicollis]UTX53196.1 ribonuclease P protein component [Leucobacter aridicollis]